MTRMIEWDGNPLALLVEPSGSDPYIVPPIVFDPDGEVIEGAAVVELLTELAIAMPVIRNATSADLAVIDQQVHRLSQVLGVPIWRPRD